MAEIIATSKPLYVGDALVLGQVVTTAATETIPVTAKVSSTTLTTDGTIYLPDPSILEPGHTIWIKKMDVAGVWNLTVDANTNGGTFDDGGNTYIVSGANGGIHLVLASGGSVWLRLGDF